MKGNLSVLAVLLGTTLLAGCRGDRPQQQDNGQPAPVELDEALVEVAKALPGFGGMFVDESGILNVLMVGAEEPQSAEARKSRDDRIHQVLSRVLGQDYLERAVARDSAAGQAGESPERFRVVRADYDVLQLSRWRASAERTLTVPGVTLTDLDERRNRVTIGIENPAARERVERVLREHGVPLEAVIIEEVKPIFFYQSLRSKHRPVVGGVQVEADTAVFGFSLCTMGFNATFNDRRGFVTNSHCTRERGENDDTDFHQDNDPLNPFADQKKVGDELFDPEFFTGGPCPDGRVCRRSDSAFVEYDSTDFLGSRIARTTLWTESLDLESSFRVVDEVFFPLAGVTLNKVGRTTGWTNGTVNRTCFNTGVAGTANVTMLCQYDVVRAPGMGRISDSGDSGSPVFRIVSGNDVELYGILWGGPDDNSFFVFSSMIFVHLDLFPLLIEFSSTGTGGGGPRPLGCPINEKCCERDPNGDCTLCIPRTAACP